MTLPLTTPQSLESMLVSTTIEPRALLSDVSAVVGYEVTRSPAKTAAGICSPSSNG